MLKELIADKGAHVMRIALYHLDTRETTEFKVRRTVEGKARLIELWESGKDSAFCVGSDWEDLEKQFSPDYGVCEITFAKGGMMFTAMLPKMGRKEREEQGHE